MKKLLGLFVFAGLMTACSNEAAKETPAATDTAAATPAAPSPVPGVADSSNRIGTTDAIKDSVMTFKEGKVLISIGGEWKPLTAAVTTSNGRKVSPNGEVSKGAVKRKMEEGMMIDKDGQMTDKNGKPMDNTGWE